MPAGLGHHNVRAQSGVATRPKGTLLSLRQNVRPNLGRTGLANYVRSSLPAQQMIIGPTTRYPRKKPCLIVIAVRRYTMQISFLLHSTRSSRRMLLLLLLSAALSPLSLL